MNNSSNKYFVKNDESGVWEDITTKFQGVAVLSLSGLSSQGKPINIFTQQWIDSQEEDFLITTLDNQNNPVVIRENTNIDITFLIKQKYANVTIDVANVHDEFISYMTGSDIWLKSSYLGNKYVHCVCLSEYKPTNMKLGRGNQSFAIGTLSFHCLEAPQGFVPSTYTLVNNPSGNPKSLGYYEREGSTSNYRLTWDTSVVSGKSYYIKS
jgi:hypothetical protein